MRIEDVQLDEALRRVPAWEPPPGFAQMVAAHAPEAMLGERPTTRLASVDSFLQAATFGVLIGIAAYVGATSIDLLGPFWDTLTMPTPLAMWTWVGMSYCVALVLTRRAWARFVADF